MYCYRQRSHVGALPHLRSSARWEMCVNVFHIHPKLSPELSHTNGYGNLQ